MNKTTIDVINNIANDILTLVNIIFEDDSISNNRKVGKNTLKDSALRNDVETKVITSDNAIIQTFFNHYIIYVEKGRKKGAKRIPIDVLRDWALKKGIPTDNNTLYAIQTAIVRDGIKGRPILATLENNIEELFEKQYFDELFTAIITELQDFFKE